MSNAQVPATSVASQPSKKSLVGKIAEKFGVDPRRFWDTLKATAFKQRNGQAPSDEQMMALLIVADQYGLNPFTKEIYAFPDKQNGIIPVVGVDGWSRIINTHPQFDGLEFRTSDEIKTEQGAKPCPEWIECVIYRKDRTRPISVPEYLDEVYRPPMGKSGFAGPWQSHTKRMLRHKATIQAARLAFGYVGIYDEDEADRIIDAQSKTVTAQPSIEFDAESQPQQIASPVKQEIMEDLANADFTGFETEEAQFVEVEQSQSEPNYAATEAEPDLVSGVSDKDARMIEQMVNFTRETGSWDTTKDNFNERYQGETLAYAQSTLKQAFNDTFPE
ncbi:recombination protein BET [Vibrio sp. JCM 19236]|nr:recombination protein BET [Vibrio sp. JCM 19236]